jgi:hypothetical protein
MVPAASRSDFRPGCGDIKQQGDTPKEKDASIQQNKQEQYFTNWKQREEIAEAMLPIIGRLYRNHGIADKQGKPPVRRSRVFATPH